MVKMMDKKGISSIVVFVAIMVVAFVLIAITMSDRITGLAKILNRNTDISGGTGLQEDNLYNLIKDYSGKKLYSDVKDLADEFIQKYPESDDIHEMYYIKLYSLIELQEYKLALKHVEEYKDEFEDIWEKFDPEYDPSKDIFTFFDYMFDGDKQLAYEVMGEFMFKDPMMPSSPSNWPHEFLDGTLEWPQLSNYPSYNIKVNPYYFMWYWHLKLTEEIEGCSSDKIKYSFLSLLNNYHMTASENKAFYNHIREEDVCADRFNSLLLEAIDEELRLYNTDQADATKTREDIGDIFEYDEDFVLDDYAPLIDAYLYWMSMDFSSMAADIDLRFLGHYTSGLWYISNVRLSMVLSCVDNGQADTVPNLNPNFDIDTDFEMKITYKGIYNLFNLDGDGTKLRINMEDSTSEEYIGGCMTTMKESYIEAYKNFKKAYDLLEEDVYKMDVDRQTGEWSKSKLGSVEISNMRAYIFPYYIQSAFIYDILEGDDDFTRTTPLLEETYLLHIFGPDNPLVANYEFDEFDTMFYEKTKQNVVVKLNCPEKAEDVDYFVCYEPDDTIALPTISATEIQDKIRIKVNAYKGGESGS